MTGTRTLDIGMSDLLLREIVQSGVPKAQRAPFLIF